MFEAQYLSQVSLLVRTLPYVAREKCFALKGGTAINLFVRNMPRLSVDIDLTYLPVEDRKKSLKKIQSALRRIGVLIRKHNPGVILSESLTAKDETVTKLLIEDTDGAKIKVEVTPVLRGAIHPPETMPVVEVVEEEFGFAETQVLSLPDLYGGKIIAALDRQHPRDLFDIHELLRNEGIDEETRAAVIVYLISHNHSPHSLLNPTLRDITPAFEQHFSGMTAEDISLETLLQARSGLIQDINRNLPDSHKQFLISFYRRQPDWTLLGLDGIEKLPAIRWREKNLDKAGKQTREALVAKLEEALAR